MNNLKDLFPETLLVDFADGHCFTTSLKIAEHFCKQHFNVINDIKKLISLLESQGSGEFSRPNFRPSESKNSRGKKYLTYKITHDGFAILAMGFTGGKALAWKIKFLEAFRAMETQLRARTEREAAALHQLRPLLMPVVQGTQQGLRRNAIGESINRSPASISYHRRSARRLGLLPQIRAS